MAMRTTINYIGVQNDDDEYGQHEEERMAIVPNLTTDSPPMRPTRPYSYYVATNFHPFDLSVLSQQLEEQQQENLKQQQQQQQLNEQQKQNKQEIHVSRKQQRQNNKKSGKKTAKQRLSVSLVDIKNTNVSVNTDGNTQEIVVNDDDSISRLKREKKAKSNQNVNEPTTPSSTLSFFKRSSHLTATMPASTSRAHKAAIIASNQSTTQAANSQPITGKINKFFRQLFRVGAEGKHHHTMAPSTIDEEEEVII
jgi:hypothetical protein